MTMADGVLRDTRGSGIDVSALAEKIKRSMQEADSTKLLRALILSEAENAKLKTAISALLSVGETETAPDGSGDVACVWCGAHLGNNYARQWTDCDDPECPGVIAKALALTPTTVIEEQNQ